jgi:hypothetical protein
MRDKSGTLTVHGPLAPYSEVSRVNVTFLKNVLNSSQDVVVIHKPIILRHDADRDRSFTAANQPEFTIPGLWFSADEIHALLLIIHILDQIQTQLPGRPDETVRCASKH